MLKLILTYQCIGLCYYYNPLLLATYDVINPGDLFPFIVIPKNLENLKTPEKLPYCL